MMASPTLDVEADCAETEDGDDLIEDAPSLEMLRKNLMETDLKESPAIKMPPPPIPTQPGVQGYEKIQVYLRIRPLLEEEIKNREDQGCMKIKDACSIELLPPKESKAYEHGAIAHGRTYSSYTFSNVYDTEIQQKDLFDASMRSYCHHFIDGTNVLVFAYGVTNSGKTHTMLGPSKDPGIIPRSIELIFSSVEDKLYTKSDLKPHMYCGVKVSDEKEIQHHEKFKLMILNTSKMDQSELYCSNDSLSSLSSIGDSETDCLDTDLSDTLIQTQYQGDIKFSIWVSFSEIYNEQIFDLLEPITKNNQKRKILQIREDKNGHPYIKDLNHIQVHSAEEALKVLGFGQKNLQYACTRLNHSSSRSHCVFNIKIIRVPNHEKPGVARVSHLSFCDLAGSERFKRTQGSNERLKEASNINTSLLTLSRCMKALFKNQFNPVHKQVVPFRESKLTRLFQTFLAGKGLAAMFVNISPAASSFDENLNAIKFAAHAKTVRVEYSLPEPVISNNKKVVTSGEEEESAEERMRNTIAWATDKETHTACEEQPIDTHIEQSERSHYEWVIDQYKTKLIELAARLDAEKVSKKSLEKELREEIGKEMQNLYTKIEGRYEAELEEQRERLETYYENKLGSYEQLCLKSVKRQKKEWEESSVVTRIEQVENKNDLTTALEQQVTNLKCELKLRDERIIQLQNDQEKAYLDMKDRSGKIEELEQEVLAVTHGLQSSDREKEKFESELNELKQKFEQVEQTSNTEKQQCTQQIESFKLRLSEQKTEYDSLVKQYEELNKTVREIRERAESSDEMESKCCELTCELDKLQGVLKRRSIELHGEMGTVQTQLLASQRECSRMKIANKKISDKLICVEKELIEERELSSLTSEELNTAKLEKDELQFKIQEHDTMKSNIQVADSNISELQTANASLATHISEQESSITALNTQIVEHTSAFNTLNTQLEDRSSSINALNSRISEQTSTINAQQTELMEHESTIAALNTQMTEHKSTISALRTEISEKRADDFKLLLDNEKLQADLEKSNTELKTVESALKDKDVQLEESRALYEERLSERSENDAELSEIKTKLKDREEELSELKEELSNSQNSVLEMESKIQQYTSMSARVDEITKQLDSQKQLHQIARYKIEHLTSELQTEKQTRHKSEQQITSLEQTRHKSEQQITSLEQTLKQKQKTSESLQVIMDAREDEWKRKQETMDSLQTNHEQTEKNIKSLTADLELNERKYNKLLTENERLNKKIQELSSHVVTDSNINSEELTLCKTRLTELNSVLEEQDSAMKLQDEVIDRKEKQVQELERKLELMESTETSDKLNYSTRFGALQEERDILTESNNKLETRNEELTQKLSKINLTNAQLADEIQTLQNQIQSTLHEENILKCLSNEQKQELSSLKNKMNKWHSEKEELVNQIEKEMKEKNDRINQLETSVSSSSAHPDRIRKLEEKVERKDKIILQLEQKIRSQESLIHEMSSEEDSRSTTRTVSHHSRNIELHNKIQQDLDGELKSERRKLNETQMQLNTVLSAHDQQMGDLRDANKLLQDKLTENTNSRRSAHKTPARSSTSKYREEPVFINDGELSRSTLELDVTPGTKRKTRSSTRQSSRRLTSKEDQGKTSAVKEVGKRIRTIVENSTSPLASPAKKLLVVMSPLKTGNEENKVPRTRGRRRKLYNQSDEQLVTTPLSVQDEEPRRKTRSTRDVHSIVSRSLQRLK